MTPSTTLRWILAIGAVCGTAAALFHGDPAAAAPAGTSHSKFPQQHQDHQPPDTLDLLRDRIRALEAERDSSRSRDARHARTLTDLADVLRRQTDSRAAADADLARELRALLDSAAASIAATSAIRLNQGLRAAERDRAAMRMEQESFRLDIRDTIAAGMAERETREGEIAATMEANAVRLQAESALRQSGDDRITLLTGMVASFLVIGLATSTLYGTSQIRGIKRNVAASAQARAQSIIPLPEYLANVERLSSMIGDIQDLVTRSIHPIPSRHKSRHRLPLQLCNEVNSINTILHAMDPSTVGRTQIATYIRNVRKHLAASHYQIIDLLGIDFDIDMPIEANFVDDPKLESGKEVISRVMRPEVRYKDKTIQVASVLVSVGT